MQLLFAELGVQPENLVFVSGIGCAARFPYYMNTYGLHGIHGRAPAVATGVALARPDLDVWVIGGDGDVLSIGGNHLIHALRRNVNLKILMFNNQIYGLTKGQYSPTSEVGKVTKSSPFGSLDTPFNPISVALGAEATFVARTHDMDRKHMMEVFRRAHEHHGAAFVEIYQNCNVFNDGAFEAITTKDARADMLIELEHGEPIRFGADREHGVVLNEFGECEIVDVAGGEIATRSCTTSTATTRRSRSRSRASPPDRRCRRPVGVFRDVERPTYEGEVQQQLAAASERQGPGDLAALLGSGADLGGRPDPRPSARRGSPVVEGADHHAGARLRREVGRLLGHPHAAPSAAARIWSTVTPRSSTAASASPVDDRRRDRGRIAAVGEGRAVERGPDGRVEPRGVDVAQRLGGRLRGASASAGPRREERDTVGVDEAEAVVGAPSRRRAGRHRRASPARRARTDAQRPRAAAAGPRGAPRTQPVERAHVELVVVELDDEAHDRVGARARRCSVAVGARGLEAVVAVGEDDGCGRRRALGSPRSASGRRCGRARGARRPSSTARRERRAVGDELAQAAGERQPPDRVEVRPRRARAARAGRSWPSAACARGGGRRRPRDRSGSASAPITPTVRCGRTAGDAAPPSGTRRAPAAASGTSVPSARHAASVARRVCVRVVRRAASGRISRTALLGCEREQRRPLVRVDHVVGWRGHRGEVGPGGVAQAAERREIGHPESLSPRRVEAERNEGARLSHGPATGDGIESGVQGVPRQGSQ